MKGRAMDEYEKGFRMTVDGLIFFLEIIYFLFFLLIVYIQYYVLVSGVQHRHQNV